MRLCPQPPRRRWQVRHDVIILDNPATSFGEFFALADLVLNGCRSLKVRGVARVDCTSHRYSASLSFSFSASGSIFFVHRKSRTKSRTMQSSIIPRIISSENVAKQVSDRVRQPLGFSVTSASTWFHSPEHPSIPGRPLRHCLIRA